MDPAAISTENLTRRSGGLLAVDRINLRVTPGQFFGFLSPNGAGKTLFNAIFQGCLVFACLVLAWLLRFEFHLPYRYLLFTAAPLLIAIRVAAIAQFGLLHGWWRYAGLRDVLGIIKAVLLGSILFFVLMRYVLHATAFPRSIYILEALLTAGALAGVRLLSRVLHESVQSGSGSYKRVMIIGAGLAAETILREIRRPGSGYVALGCLDDDRSKLGIRIHGVPVLGAVEQLPKLLGAHPADEILIAVPSATGSQMRRFVEICEQSHVPFKTVPALRDIIAGEVSIRQLRKVNLEDLLNREPARIDLESVQKQIARRVVLVTGAAGSIGSELCRQILEYSPAKLVCVDQNETGLFYLGHDLSSRLGQTELISCVADIRDVERLRGIFAQHSPLVVFHAAAYKHVPIMELNVQEAVQNNVFALTGLLEVAEAGKCESFVLISSDKAVNPASVMGVTKRIGELILSSRPRNGMRCVSVRFGNVLGSSGSVVPILERQLQANQPLTITHPEIKRFFMTTPEAVALVLQAFAIGEHGDILVLDMGEPIKILELAQSLIRLSGKSEEAVPIRFTGLRVGEKLIEELFYPNEVVHATRFDEIKITRGTIHGWHDLQRLLRELKDSLTIDGAAPVRAKLGEIVPEYSCETKSTDSSDQPILQSRSAVEG